MSLKTRLTLVTAALALALPTAVSAIETITVTASRFDTSAESQLTVVNTIERSEIERIASKSVVDLLERVPGLSVNRTGGAGQTASISIRGGQSDHVLVLVDGVRIGSATLGSTDFSVISPEQVERIEVVKGPRAAVWGSDAIGGVIQIFSRKLQGGEYTVSAEGGSDSYQRYGAGVGIDHGDGASTIVVGYERSDGFDVLQDDEPDNDGYDRTNIGINGRIRLDEQWQLGWQGQYYSGSNEYDDFYGSTGANESDYDNYYWNLNTKYQQGGLQTQLSVGQSQDQLDTYRDNVVAKQRFETERDQLGWTNHYQLNEEVSFVAGVDWSRESINGDYAEDERDLLGVYGVTQVNKGAWLAEVAVRYDDVDNIDSETSANASIGYRLNDKLRISAGYGTGFKAPTFNDLYYPNSGNPDLRSETSENFDLTISYSNDFANGYLSWFDTEVDDLINWTPTGEFDDFGWEIWRPSNVDKATIQGIELGADVQWFGLDHRIGYIYLDSEDESNGDNLVGRAQHEADYAVSYQWHRLDLMAQYQYQGKRYNGRSFAGDKQHIDSYNQVDLSLGYYFDNGFKLRASVNNLFDDETVSVANYNAPGRQWFVSIAYANF